MNEIVCECGSVVEVSCEDYVDYRMYGYSQQECPNCGSLIDVESATFDEDEGEDD